MLYPEGKVEYPDLQLWNWWRKRIKTGVGGLSAGFRSEILLRGYKVTEELTGNISFIQGWTLALTGRIPDKKEDRLLNAMFINTALADPRFWLFRTARLAATVKSSPAACIAAGILTNEAEFFSAGAAYNTSKFFQGALGKVKSNKATIEELVKTKLAKQEKIYGFGRVLARGPDERNQSLLKVAKECSLDNGEHMKLAFEIEALLQRLKNSELHMNNGGLKCALLSDMGFSPQQIMQFYSLMFIIGIAGNVTEAYERPPGEFLPLSPDDIEYIGPPLRPLPAASDQQTIMHQAKKGRIVAMDSISFIEMSNRGDVIICGSHGGIPAAEYSLNYHPRGIVFNDAGKGKEDAGIKGLETMSEANIPAAAVAVDSARIGDGIDTYYNGTVSSYNGIAYKHGVREGMSVKDASIKMLK